jgi:hypothetical protein
VTSKNIYKEREGKKSRISSDCIIRTREGNSSPFLPRRIDASHNFWCRTFSVSRVEFMRIYFVYKKRRERRHYGFSVTDRKDVRGN